MGLWVIGYGIIQASAPALRRSWGKSAPPGASAVQFWSAVLTAIPALIAISLWRDVGNPGIAVVVGLAAFGAVFAMNSSIHSYMVLAYTDAESVSLNVGFYYMANAAGRLMGTLLSGALPAGLPLDLRGSGGRRSAGELLAAGAAAGCRNSPLMPRPDAMPGPFEGPSWFASRLGHGEQSAKPTAMTCRGQQPPSAGDRCGYSSTWEMRTLTIG
jgi:hypothetical protein